TALEPYRRKLSFMWKRLEANLTTAPSPNKYTWSPLQTEVARETPGTAVAYAGAEQLLHNLKLVQSSLLKDGEVALTEGALARLIRQVEVFGFYFVSLDV